MLISATLKGSSMRVCWLAPSSFSIMVAKQFLLYISISASSWLVVKRKVIYFFTSKNVGGKKIYFCQFGNGSEISI
jgi:hypothetical protein